MNLVSKHLCWAITCLLLLSFFSCMGNVQASTNYAPIRINSNSDFDAEHGITDGNGTEADPWIIEDYNINGTGYGYCIYIGNTTDYFKVKIMEINKHPFGCCRQSPTSMLHTMCMCL